MIYTYIYLLYIYIIHIYSEIGETIYTYIYTFTTTETGETTLSRTVFSDFPPAIRGSSGEGPGRKWQGKIGFHGNRMGI